MGNQHVLGFIENFSRLLAHGMKNRLTPAVTAAYLLEDEASVSPEKLKNLAGLSIRSLQGALDILTSLEDFARIQPSPAIPTEIIPWLLSLGEKQQIEIQVTGEPARLQLDRVLWETIVCELLLNVKQHGSSKADVRFAKNSKAGDVEHISIRIEDSGPGLGKMTAERAMEATRKGESSKGAGLGLSKALWAAILLDGSVELTSSDNGGVIAEASARAA